MALASTYRPLLWVWLFVLMGIVVNLASAALEGAHIPPGLAKIVLAVRRHQGPFFAAAAAYSVLFSVAWFCRRWKRTQGRLRDAFTIFASAANLDLSELGLYETCPEEALEGSSGGLLRPYFGTYFPRAAVELTDSAIDDVDDKSEFSEADLELLARNGPGFLLVDHDHSGKTSTAFQVLRRLPRCIVVGPDDSQSIPPVEILRPLRRHKVVVLVDNLGALALANYNLQLLVKRMAHVTKNKLAVVGTCREKNLPAIVAGQGNYVANVCESLPKFRLRLLTAPERVALARTAGVSMDVEDAYKYPFPGNITMKDLNRIMRERFGILPEIHKDTLRTLRLLDTGGIPLTVPRLKIVLVDVFQYNSETSVTDVFRHLVAQSFLLEQPSGDKIYPHLGHLEYAVSFREGAEPALGHWDALMLTLGRNQDKDALLHLSLGFRRMGDGIRSLEALDRLVGIAPENAQAHFYRGYTLARLDRLREALDANTKALQLQPGYAEAYSDRAYILGRSGQSRLALEAADLALKVSPDLESAHIHRATNLSRLGRQDEAAAVFNAVVARQPDSYHAHLHLGITLANMGSFEEAVRIHHQAVGLRPEYAKAHRALGITLARWGQYERALESFDRAIELEPDNPTLYFSRSITLANQERIEDALVAAETAVKLDPNYPEAHYQRAFILCRLDRLDEALTAIDLALKLRPEHPEAHYRRAFILCRLDRLDEALTAIDLALKLRPEYPQAHHERAFILCRLDRLDEALTAIDLALKLKPEYPQAHHERAFILDHQDRLDEALTAIDLALKLRPEYPEAHYQRAFILCHLDRLDEALTAIDLALKLRPEYPEAHCQRAFILDHQDRLYEALMAIDLALKLKPEYPEAHHERAYNLSRQGHFDEALEAADEALRLKPDYPEARFHRGYILGRLHRDEEALEEYNRVIQRDPAHAGALFEKARTLCFLIRHSLRLHRERFLVEVMDLLERAASINPEVVQWLEREKASFRALETDPSLRARFEILLWGRNHGVGYDS